MSYIDNCPNCGSSLKGIFGSKLLSKSKIDLINSYMKLQNEYYCTSCSKSDLKFIASELKKDKTTFEARIKQIIFNIPVLTCPAPISWQYEVLGMVSTQNSTGTGFLTDLSRGFNDFFGAGSKSTNNKISAATALCKTDLRIQCVKFGGNAIISTDIDFNEIGAGSANMLMVCMAGTAINVTDYNNFNAQSRDKIKEIIELTDKLVMIEEMDL